MVTLTEVSKSYGGAPVLNNVSLRFPAGQTHVLLGSSGCGKSTLLRIIMGLIPADQGEILIGIEAMNAKTRPHLTQKIGYVIQDGGLFPHLTARENLTLVAQTLGWEVEKIGARVAELLRLVGFEDDVLKRYPKELSGGQKQRVSLMRALMLDPKYLLLDEPLGALDPVVRADLQEQLKVIFNAVKKTVIIVTHDIGEAAFFGHTIALLNDGMVMQHGSFQDLVEAPATPFVTKFINAQRPVPQLKDFM